VKCAWCVLGRPSVCSASRGPFAAFQCAGCHSSMSLANGVVFKLQGAQLEQGNVITVEPGRAQVYCFLWTVLLPLFLNCHQLGNLIPAPSALRYAFPASSAGLYFVDTLLKKVALNSEMVRLERVSESYVHFGFPGPCLGPSSAPCC
jgi:hypothetical protein